MCKTALRRRLFEQQLSQSGWKPKHPKLASKDSDILTLGVEISSGLAQRSVRLHRFLYVQIGIAVAFVSSRYGCYQMG